MKIFFLVPYPADVAPSQRFRVEAYYKILLAQGVEIETQPFLDLETWHILYQPGHILKKSLAVMRGYMRRFLMLFRLSGSDFVFIHRESAPFGPPIIEFMIAKILRRKIIFDFDDAIWVADHDDESRITQAFKWRRKVAAICRWSYKVSAGNQYLADYARKHNPNVIINPTVVDASGHHNPKQFPKRKGDHAVICWTGSDSTVRYLEELTPVLQSIKQKYPSVELLVITGQEPKLGFQFRYVPWTKDAEVRALADSDIGIMPLPDTEWTRGKCGFKAIQYMSMSLATVASRVGVNSTIITHGENGFLASNHEDWTHYLEKLITDKKMREEMGTKARERIIRSYSIESNSSTFLSLFETAEYSDNNTRPIT